MNRLTMVAALVAALTLTVGLGSASAHKRKFERQTTLNFEELPGSTGDRISGQVSVGPPPEEPLPPEGFARTAAGAAKKCLKNQTVEIKQRLTGEGGGGGGTSTIVATATTDANGAWQATAYEASGANQLKFDVINVEVVKKRVAPKTDRHKHVCIGAFANKTVFSY